MSTTIQATRADFLAAYRDELMAADEIGWTRNPEQFAAFMARVEHALATDAPRANWSPTSAMTARACRRVGLRGTPSLKALRALPAEDRPMRVPGGAA